jgi:hypothetical protein
MRAANIIRDPLNRRGSRRPNSQRREPASSIDADWHLADMTTTLHKVRYQGQSGKHVLAASFSGFDPEAKRWVTR